MVVTGITASSAFVRPGDLFVALPGHHTHGAVHAAAAIGAGASAVLTDTGAPDAFAAHVPVLVTPDPRAVLGDVSSEVYGHPSRRLRMLGVTGTSGKTTTTFFMEAGLHAAGRTVGLIGTVATHLAGREIKLPFTTPEAPELHALLAVMTEEGITDVAMEVSSHALAMGRVGGIEFEVAGFTNLSEDHLDFHRDMRDYYEAKRSLFTRHSRAPGRVIVTDGARESWSGQLISDITAFDGGGITTVSRHANVGTWYVSGGIQHEFDGSTRFVIRRSDVEVGPGQVPIEAGCAVPGDYNVDNVLLALAMLHHAGVEPTPEVVGAIARATVPGRMEPIQLGQDYLAIVDYSHKPAAVEGAIRALRPLTRNHLIVVLGCGGDRDRGKRPHMGEIAARGADLLIVTDDNPRSEDPAAIREAMLGGALAVPADLRGEVEEIADRQAAIRAAVEQARPGDTVLVAGKGHEPGQEIAGTVHPFDDREELRRAIAEVGRP